MQFSENVFVLLLTIITACLVSIYLLIQSRKPKKPSYGITHNVYKNHYKKISNNNEYILDPHEAKLLKTIIESPNNTGIDVKTINELLHLTKLSKENQRQRRHIVLKELNLKLYLITGDRETIKRIPSEADKRVKYYNFESETLELDMIKNLLFNKS